MTKKFEIEKWGLCLCNGSRTSGVMVKNFMFTRPFICFGLKRNLVSIICLWNMV